VASNFLQRRRARLLIARTQPFADEPLVAAANFTWLDNSMGAQPGVRGRDDLAARIPNWTLIGAGAYRAILLELPDRVPAVLQPFGRHRRLADPVGRSRRINATRVRRYLTCRSRPK
jgi:hypothetical protein